MMVKYIFLICLLLTVAIMYFVTSPIGKKNGKLLLGVTLPDSAFLDEEILNTCKSYERKRKLIFIVLAGFSLFSLYRTDYFSVTFIHFVIAMFLICITPYLPFIKTNKKIKQIKKENNWINTTSQIRKVDLSVTRIKSSMTLQNRDFLIVTLLNLIVFIINRKVEFNNVIGFSAITASFLLLIMNNLLKKMKSKVYSSNTEINKTINLNVKKSWSIFYFIISLANLFIYIIVINYLNVSSIFMVISILSTSILLCLLALLINRNSRNLEKQLLENENSSEVIDEDEYWKMGMFYNNPNDNSLFVNDRVGIGNSINYSKKSAKVIISIIILFTAIILLPIASVTIINDITVPEMIINDKTISIKSYKYDYDLKLDEIISINIKEGIPIGYKTNAIATSMYLRGNYNISGYGNSKLYIMTNANKYIVIELEDTFILYNESSVEETEKLFKTIKKIAN